MTRRPFLRLGAAVCLLAGATALFSQDPVIRVEVRLIRILATVKNAAGQLVGSLDRGDFQILDNGVPQELKIFEHHTEQPLSVAMLVDTSASTGIELKYELESVARFLRALVHEGNPKDTVALYTFNYDVVLQNRFTRRTDLLEASLKGIHPQGGTSLYDAIFFASQALDDREGRHVIVLITDGGDTTSAKSYHQALEAAQLADTVIYPILVMPITNDAGRNIGGENALTTLAAGTGGRVFAPSLGASLDSAFADILKDLRTQYLLAYYPKNLNSSKDRFHRIEVKVKSPDLRVLARNGYYEESEQGRGWTPVR
jgi:Ca-activated chloride channel homolog